MRGEIVASYKDWMNIDNPNDISERDLRKAVSQMSSAANKRLRRFEKAGINYSSLMGEDTISGVRKFGVKGKTYDDVKNEFKRVRNFLSSPQSSLSGMAKAYRDFENHVKEITGNKIYHRLNRKETKEYEKMMKQKKAGNVSEPTKRMSRYEKLKRWRDTWDYYNKLVEEGYYAPSSQDSNQVRDAILAQVYTRYETDLSDEETWENIKRDLTNLYESSVEQDINISIDSGGLSTSSFFSMGESD